MAQSILYYPSINIEDGAWLRSALLYWDEINSIVPHKDYVLESPELLYLQDVGQYKPIYSRDILLLNKANEFASEVERIFKNRSSKTPFNKNINSKKEKICIKQIAELIHYNKIPDRTIEFLIEKGIIQELNKEWIEMDHDDAILYMKLLAKFAAKYSERDTVIGTSTRYEFEDIYPKGKHKNDYSVVSISLTDCLPIPSPDVDLETLIYFKKHHLDDLLELRTKIRNFEENIAKSENRLEIKAKTESFKELWIKEIISAEKMFKGMGIGYILGSMCSFITMAEGFTNFAQLTESSILNNRSASIVAGLVGVGAYTLKSIEQIKKKEKEGGFAYNISAKRDELL